MSATEGHAKKLDAYNRRGAPTQGQHPGTWQEFAKELENDMEQARRSAENMRDSFLRLAGAHPKCILFPWEIT